MARVAVSAVAGGGLVLGVVGFTAVPVFAQPDALPSANSETGVDVEMTVETADGPISLLDAAHPVSTHLTGGTGMVTVSLTIAPDQANFYDYVDRLVAPDAPFGGFQEVCSTHTVVAEGVFRCELNVPIQRGVNRLDFFVAAFGINPTVVHGSVLGAPFGAELRVQMQQADGSWKRFWSGSAIEVVGTQTSAIGYSVQNTGSLPFVVQGSCSTEPVLPGAELECGLRGPRPGYALAGRYVVPLRLIDQTGLPVDLTLSARVALRSGESDAGLTSTRTVTDDAVAATSLAVAALAVPLALLLRRRLRRSAPGD